MGDQLPNSLSLKFNFVTNGYSCSSGPWVDDLDPAPFKIFGVSGRNSRALSATDGGDLTVELADRSPGTAPLGGDGRIGLGGGAVEGQDAVLKKSPAAWRPRPR